VVAGGNPDLDPTDAESFTEGIVLTPSAVNGPQISGGYWRIEMNPAHRVRRLDLIRLLSTPFQEIARATSQVARAGDIIRHQ
jgi:hypothetical protein